MARKPDLSWPMKVTIWELAARLNSNRAAIQRSLDQQCDEGALLEDVPSDHTIKKVLDEFQTLFIPMLKTLPEHMWPLRTDYEQIRGRLEGERPAEAPSEDAVKREIRPRLIDGAGPEASQLALSSRPRPPAALDHVRQRQAVVHADKLSTMAETVIDELPLSLGKLGSWRPPWAGEAGIDFVWSGGRPAERPDCGAARPRGASGTITFLV